MVTCCKMWLCFLAVCTSNWYKGPNNTVVFYNILPYSKESFNRFYADFIMDRILKNFMIILSDFCCLPGICTVEHPEDSHRSDRHM